jgi:hypothetical protein
MWSTLCCRKETVYDWVFVYVIRGRHLHRSRLLALSSWRWDLPPSSIIWGLYNRPELAAVPSGLSPTPLIIIIIIILEKPPVVQLLRNFPQYYGIRRFITVLTRALHRSLFWARSIQPIPPNPISLRPTLILSTYLRLGLPSVLFPSECPTNIPHAFLFFPLILHALPISSSLTWSVQVMKLLSIQFSPTSRHFISLVSKYSPQHPVLKHPSLCPSLNGRYQVLHTYRTKCKIIVLCILIFTFLIR